MTASFFFLMKLFKLRKENSVNEYILNQFKNQYEHERFWVIFNSKSLNKQKYHYKRKMTNKIQFC